MYRGTEYIRTTVVSHDGSQSLLLTNGRVHGNLDPCSITICVFPSTNLDAVSIQRQHRNALRSIRMLLQWIVVTKRAHAWSGKELSTSTW